MSCCIGNEVNHVHLCSGEIYQANDLTLESRSLLSVILHFFDYNIDSIMSGSFICNFTVSRAPKSDERFMQKRRRSTCSIYVLKNFPPKLHFIRQPWSIVFNLIIFEIFLWLKMKRASIITNLHNLYNLINKKSLVSYQTVYFFFHILQIRSSFKMVEQHIEFLKRYLSVFMIHLLMLLGYDTIPRIYYQLGNLDLYISTWKLKISG